MFVIKIWPGGTSDEVVGTLKISGKKMVYNFQTQTAQHEQKSDYGSLDGETTQCSWQTLWLYAEYRVYTTVYTELVYD